MSDTKSPIKAHVPLACDDSPPRPKPGRKVSTGTFGTGQRASLLVPFVDAETEGDRSDLALKEGDEPQELEPDEVVEQNAAEDTPPSPSSFHTAVMSANESPLNRIATLNDTENIGTQIDTQDSDTPEDIPLLPKTPQTSTSLASCLSDTSTLGPLATQQDILSDPVRAEEWRVGQRKKLEKMLGSTGPSGDDDGNAEAGPEDWVVIDDGQGCRSKLERTLGTGADSAHVALNAEYRRRASVPDRQSEDSATPLLPSVAVFARLSSSRTNSTTDVRALLDGKEGRTGSFSNVLETGKKTLARLNQGSGLRGKRTGSPILGRREKEDWADPGNLLSDPLGDLDVEERKVLLNRTRKLGRVLGETLNEREVGELVVGRSRGGSPVIGADAKFEREDALDDGPLNISTQDDSATRDKSSPLSPTLKRIRRYSDPTSPGLLSPLDESPENEGDERMRAKQQRRMRLDKLNRLLGAHVPIELLGPAMYLAEARGTEQEVAAEDAGQPKKRAVKVASKMFAMFGEPPPVNACLPGVAPKQAEESNAPHGYRSRLKTSVALYHQTINSISYLIEHDRRLLHSVMDELDSKPDFETDAPPNIRRERSLSSPTAPISPLPTIDDETYEPLPSLRKRAIKLNSFFGDPRTAASHIRGCQSRVYEETDRKAQALERLLSDLEEDVKGELEGGELGEDELVEIRESISDTRRVVSMHGDL